MKSLYSTNSQSGLCCILHIYLMHLHNIRFYITNRPSQKSIQSILTEKQNTNCTNFLKLNNIQCRSLNTSNYCIKHIPATVHHNQSNYYQNPDSTLYCTLRILRVRITGKFSSPEMCTEDKFYFLHPNNIHFGIECKWQCRCSKCIHSVEISIIGISNRRLNNMNFSIRDNGLNPNNTSSRALWPYIFNIYLRGLKSIHFSIPNKQQKCCIAGNPESLSKLHRYYQFFYSSCRDKRCIQKNHYKNNSHLDCFNTNNIDYL